MNSFNYYTIDGETWASIAYKMYGTTQSIPVLIEANPKIPIDTIFPRDTLIIVPILDKTDSNVVSSNLPPWK